VYFCRFTPEEKKEMEDWIKERIDKELSSDSGDDSMDSSGLSEFSYDSKFLRPVDPKRNRYDDDDRNLRGRDEEEYSDEYLDAFEGRDDEYDERSKEGQKVGGLKLHTSVLPQNDYDDDAKRYSKKSLREKERNVRKTLGLLDFDESDDGDDEDDDDEEQLKQDMTEKEYQELFGDWEGMKRKIHEKVYEIRDDEADPFDILMDEAMLGSMKTRSGDYEILLDHPKRRRVHIPPARSLRQLQYSSMTRLTVDPTSPGYAVGESVWGQLQKNMYFTGPQRFKFSDGIAKEYNNIMEFIAKTDPATIDGIYDPQFRKGLAYRKKLEAERKDQVPVIKKRAVQKVEQTDWSVEAVEDEDAL
jgi:hypothetical protein